MVLPCPSPINLKWIPQKLTGIKRRVWCLIVFAMTYIACITTGIGVGYGLRVRNFKGAAGDDDSNSSSSRTIYLEAELISVDPVASTMVMNWFIFDDNCYQLENACTHVNIYFDNNLLQHTDDDSKVNQTNQAHEDPIFEWFPNDLSDYSQSSIFRTTSLLFNRENKKNRDVDSTLQDYPFDVYFASVFLYANDTETNLPVNLSVLVTEGIAVGFKSLSDIQLEDPDSPGSFFYLNIITFQRNALVRTYVLTIVIGVWLVTLTFVGSAMKIMFKYEQPKQVFAIPVATLFAFTSLRGTMPGAPAGFGAIIDFVGLLPCLAIITLVSVILLAYMVLFGGNDEENMKPRPPPLKLAANKWQQKRRASPERSDTPGEGSGKFYMAKDTPDSSFIATGFQENMYEPLDYTNYEKA